MEHGYPESSFKLGAIFLPNCFTRKYDVAKLENVIFSKFPTCICSDRVQI